MVLDIAWLVLRGLPGCFSMQGYLILKMNRINLAVPLVTMSLMG